jgi:putative hydrolase of HD superfamily
MKARKKNAVSEFVCSLPEPYRVELTALFHEMNAMKTPEAKIYKALDKMEALIQHNEADITTWLPLEYDLNLTYGTEETSFSDYMQTLRKTLNDDSVKKIHNEKSRTND